MVQLTRRTAIGLALAACGCSRFQTPGEQTRSGPFPNPDEVFASADFSRLRFHQRTERPTPPEVVDLWADSEVIIKATGIVRFGYRREEGIAEPLRLVQVCCDVKSPLTPAAITLEGGFLKPFAKRAPLLSEHLRAALSTISSDATSSANQAYQAEQFVGELDLEYRQEWESTFLTIGFYDIGFYNKQLRVPGTPSPELLAGNMKQR